MKPPPFAYLRPGGLAEAITMLAEYGDQAKVLAGGQSLVPLLAFRLARPQVLIDINECAELEHLALEEGTLSIGSLTRHRAVERFDALGGRAPIVAEAVREIGHVAIRNRGTVGGSIAHADPAAEWPVLAMILDAEFEVVSAAGSRVIPAAEMFAGYFETAMTPAEILTGLRFSLPPPSAGSAFVEVSRRHGDFALSGAGAVLTVEDGRVSDARLGLLAASLTPVRASNAEATLIGQEPTDEVLEAAAAEVDAAIAPLGDVHATSEYKRHLARITSGRALRRARDRAVAWT